jgi:hypothetical protein
LLLDRFIQIKASTRFEDLDNAEGGTGHEAFDPWFEVSHVPIQIGPVQVAQAFDVAFVRDGIAQVIVLTCPRKGFFLAKDGVVDEDAVHTRIFVGFLHDKRNVRT